MFGIGPMELAVLAVVGLIVLGPERLPGFARQAAQMIRTLRELATGARQQLRDELGPEFADVDLRNLNPRTAVRRVLFDDDFDLDSPAARRRLREALLGDDEVDDLQAADPREALHEPVNGHEPVRMTKPTDGLGVPSQALDSPQANGTARSRPRPSPRPRPFYDEDIT